MSHGLAKLDQAAAGTVKPSIAASPNLPRSSCSSASPVGSTPQLVPSICVTNTVLCVPGSNCGGTPTSTNVQLWVNATGNKVTETHPPWVQVVFLVETTMYDGVYDSSSGNYGNGTNGPDPCSGPCMESDGVPFFVHNVANITQGITMRNTGNSTIPGVASSPHVTFGLVDYSSNNDSSVAGSDDHDDGNGNYYSVDVSSFEPASAFNSTVSTMAGSDTLFGGHWVSSKSIFGGSNFATNFLDSPMISAMYGVLHGSGFGWISNSTTYHVIVWIGSTLPKDPNYPGDYCVTYNDYAKTCPDPTPTVEPTYTFGSGLSVPSGENLSAIATLAKSENVVIDTIDLPDGMTEVGSGDYVTGNSTDAIAADTDVTSILSAGCYLAQQTGGSWEGPSQTSTGVGFACSAAPAGSGGSGNLTNTFRTPSIGNYTWSDNPSLGWALTNITFPVIVSSSTTVAYGTKTNTFDFVPLTQNDVPALTFNATSMVFKCIQNGTVDITTACDAAWSASVNGGEEWGWPFANMYLNDSWSVLFSVSVGTNFPSTYLNTPIPVDVCTTYAGCLGTGSTGLGADVLSEVNYANYVQDKVTHSFPPAFVTVESPAYPPLTSVGIAPATALVAANGETQPFVATPDCSATCQPGATYVWNLTNDLLGALNASTGNTVGFNALNRTGTVGLFVNATLDGVTIESTAAVITVTALTSVSVSPKSVLLDPTYSQTFSVTPICTAACPPGAAYSWNLTNSAMGSFGGANNDSVTFTAGYIGGDVGLFVNASLDGISVQSSAVLITINSSVPVSRLEGVAVSPTSGSTNPDGLLNFTAIPACSLVCTSGITYSWNLTNNTIGSLSTPIHLGPLVTFTAGKTLGTVGLFVIATLEGITVRSVPVTITVTAPVALDSVSVTPPSAVVPLGASQLFTAIPVCSPSCPSGVTYTWSLANSVVGWLNASTGDSVIFRLNCVPECTIGTDQLFVNASWNDVTKMGSPVHIVTVVSLVPTIAVFTVDPSTIPAGSWTNFTVGTYGGVGELTYSYVGLPPGCSSGNQSVIACRPTSAGTYGVTITVNDQANHSVSESTTLSVFEGLAIASFSINPATVAVGHGTMLTTNSSGGVGALTYHYTGLPPGCSSQDVASLSCIPSDAGGYAIRVYVNDSGGYSANATAKLAVTGISSPTSILVSPMFLDSILTVFVIVVVLMMLTAARRKETAVPEEAPPPVEDVDEVPEPPRPPQLPPPGAKDVEPPPSEP